MNNEELIMAKPDSLPHTYNPRCTLPVKGCIRKKARATFEKPQLKGLIVHY
jgi:hypothetical protein